MNFELLPERALVVLHHVVRLKVVLGKAWVFHGTKGIGIHWVIRTVGLTVEHLYPEIEHSIKSGIRMVHLCTHLMSSSCRLSFL